MTLEEQATQLLVENGWSEPKVTKADLAGSASDMDAIVNGPRWLSRMVARKHGVRLR